MGVVVTALLYVGVDMTGILPSTDNPFIGGLGFCVVIGIFAWVIFSRKQEDKLEGRDLKM